MTIPDSVVVFLQMSETKSMTQAEKITVATFAAEGWFETAKRTLERDDYSVPCDPRNQMSFDFIEGTAEELGFSPTKSAVRDMRKMASDKAFEIMRKEGGEVLGYFERNWKAEKFERDEARKMKQFRADWRASWA